MIRELRPADPVTVGPYRLLGRLGSGGMGQVYLAISPGGRMAAVKVIRPELADERGFRERFAREVAAARNVSGVFTAAVVDADPGAEIPWMATAYVAGPSLTDAVSDEGPLPASAVRALAAGLAEGLQAIHAAGLVHRDLKPSNVLLAADGPRVIDFGISRAREGSMLTQTGAVMGTPGFLSPEQAKGSVVGPASDIFSLGAVLVFAATGAGPFGAGSTASLLYRVVHEPPELSPVPPDLRPLVEWCLAKSPDDRPAPGQLLDQLSDGAGALTPQWLPETITDSLRRYVPVVPAPAALPDPETVTAPPRVPVSPEPPADEPAAGVPAAERPANGRPAAHGQPSLPARRGSHAGRRRLLVAAMAAVSTVTIVAVILSVTPARPRASAAGERASASTTTSRPAPNLAAASRSAAERTTEPAAGSHSASHPADTAGTRSAVSPRASSPAAVVTTPQPSPARSRPPSGGAQVISAVSGASSIGCGQYGSAASGTGGSTVPFSFINSSRSGIQVWYLTIDGSGILEATVSPGRSFSPHVVTRQDWMIADSSGGCLGLFSITGGGDIVAV